jgi:hypothetical protein
MVSQNTTLDGTARTAAEYGQENATTSSYVTQPNIFRKLCVRGKEIIEIQKSNHGDKQIAAVRLEDGSVLSAQEVAEAYQNNQTEGLQVVTGSTTDSLVIKSVRGYSKVPLSALPRFY